MAGHRFASRPDPAITLSSRVLHAPYWEQNHNILDLFSKPCYHQPVTRTAPTTPAPTRPIPGRIWAGLNVLAALMAHARHFAATATTRVAAQEFATAAAVFGTNDLPTLLHHRGQ